MKFTIKHELKNRMRVHLAAEKMTFEQADLFQYYLQEMPGVVFVKVYERTADAVIEYRGSRREILTGIQRFCYENVEVPSGYLENSGRAGNAMYQEKLIQKIAVRYVGRWLVPYPVWVAVIGFKALRYIKKGLHVLRQGKIEVPVLDATAIGVSLVRSDFNTAGSIMFLLGIGELLEEWTHKKSVDDLARSMSLNVTKVWEWKDGKEEMVNATEIQPGSQVVVHMGNVIPFDGKMTAGEAMVNQASLTGESVPVRKETGMFVYAGTVVEEGEMTLEVTEVGASRRFQKIVSMIEESEKLKSGLECKAENLANKLVPYSFAGTALTYLLTGNAARALSVLMVDYSCALKLAMPISVLSAIREANLYGVTVKGGKYLEAVAQADTIVFDKTGTLTKAKPTVVDVVSFNGQSPDELLRVAACLEEHFPHSMAKAVMEAAEAKKLKHEEMHTKVEYLVAHGISTTINGRKAIIGSFHFVFEDEKCIVPEEQKEKFTNLPKQYSRLYMAIDGRLAAVICIEDPLRPEAKQVIDKLHACGFEKIVMMTGDGENTASAIAREVGVDEYYSEVLPEDKAQYVEKQKEQGRKVIMIGDGINDSPALSAADVGIAISDGAEIAREIADITIGAENLQQLITLRTLSEKLMKRIGSNYRSIVGFNSMLILLGTAGIITPTASALLHNSSTLLIGLRSMNNLLD